jgi:hypothetical protein
MTKDVARLIVTRSMLCQVARHRAGIVATFPEPQSVEQARQQIDELIERICSKVGVDKTVCGSLDELLMVIGHHTQRRNWLCDIMPSRDPETRPV